MLAGHMDEIALIVSGIEKGFLRVTRIGGFDPRVLFGQRVTVHGRRELPGMVVSVPPHFTAPAEREKPVPLEKLFVDVGLPPDEVERDVRVGDVITLDAARMLRLNGSYAACKAMDDRAAVAAIVLCLEELARRRAFLGRLRRGHRAGGDGLHRRGRRRLRPSSRPPRSPSTSPSASSPGCRAPRP